jgi:hypothetical protein
LEEGYLYTHIRVAHLWLNILLLSLGYHLANCHSRSTWCWFRYRQFAFVWWRWSCSFPLPSYMPNCCFSTLPGKAAIHLIFMDPSRESFYFSIHVPMPLKLNSPLTLFWDFNRMFHDQLLHFFFCGIRKFTFGNFAHVKCKCMSDCSSFTQPHCLAILADMLETYKKVVAAVENETWLLPLPYTLQQPSLSFIRLDLSTLRDTN